MSFENIILRTIDGLFKLVSIVDDFGLMRKEVFAVGSGDFENKTYAQILLLLFNWFEEHVSTTRVSRIVRSLPLHALHSALDKLFEQQY